MSTRTEYLTERINSMRAAIVEKSESGEDTLHLDQELKRLLKELQSAQGEGKQVLTDAPNRGKGVLNE